MTIDLTAVELSATEFQRIAQLLYRLCGITLPHGKEGLVKARLARRLRTLGLSTFDYYVEHVERDQTGAELTGMIDARTTNKTSFFRDAAHFEFLRQEVLPEVRRTRGRLRIWSAGCSSGEEPYTLGIVLREELPDLDRMDARVLATDISTRVLAKVRAAIYDEETLQDVPPALVTRYFTHVTTAPARTYRVHDSVRSLVHTARLNLMEPWPMRGPFDAIFCRNVMIYFDKQTRQELVRRYWELLRPGGHLFVGLSESLTSLSHNFHYVQPAVYVKR